jgi:hypothetical protein
MDKVAHTPAERMRAHCKRRRQEQPYVRVLLNAPQIDSLIGMGLLKEERRQDPEALESSIYGLLDWALEDQELAKKIAHALRPIGT